MSELHSTGRGGAGNIAKDTNTYVDGGIIREGAVGDQGDGAYSAGRGGAGNINSPHIKPSKGQAGDSDVVPETAIRRPGEEYDNYHTGVSSKSKIHGFAHNPLERRPRQYSQGARRAATQRGPCGKGQG